jgi:hypothetical protein
MESCLSIMYSASSCHGHLHLLDVECTLGKPRQHRLLHRFLGGRSSRPEKSERLPKSTQITFPVRGGAGSHCAAAARAPAIANTRRSTAVQRLTIGLRSSGRPSHTPSSRADPRDVQRNPVERVSCSQIERPTIRVTPGEIVRMLGQYDRAQMFALR